MMPANVGTADILQVIFAKANPLNCRSNFPCKNLEFRTPE
jgi:hypothetical protein